MSKYQRNGYQWENSFQKSIKKYLPDAFIYKIMDTHSIEGLLTKLKKTHTEYQDFLIPKVPADFMVIHQGRTIMIECKSTIKLDHFPLRNIKPHQIQMGVEIDGAGGEYIFAIQRDEPRNKRVFLISVNTLIAIQLKLGKKKVIPWHVMEKNPDVIELVREKGSLFQMEALLYVP
ncbi:MAG: Holliday junction resolvase RecU [Candidatus Omnitrophica bacterium]|nr:Holliday junction resolvase RecU [Candidatus Omnitrophota bacterium]